MEALSDRELLLRIRRGEVEDYGELVQRYQAVVFNVCFRILRNRQDAEDVAQETFIRAYRKLDTFDAKRPFKPWILRVGTNLCLNRIKRRKITEVSIDDEYQQLRLGRPDEHPEKALIQQERTVLIGKAMDKLPGHYRLVIELRHFQGMQYGEISEMINLPLNTVKSHLHRGRKLLAKLLKKTNYD